MEQFQERYISLCEVVLLCGLPDIAPNPFLGRYRFDPFLKLYLFRAKANDKVRGKLGQISAHTISMVCMINRMESFFARMATCTILYRLKLMP